MAADAGDIGGRAALARYVARRIAGHPRDVWLAARMLGWAMVLPLLKRVVPPPALARLMWCPPRGQGDGDRVETIVALSRLVTRARPGSARNCYERSLIAYRYLARAGAAPKLVVGVRREGGSISGHAWVSVRGRSLWEPGGVERFSEVAVFGRGGGIEG